MKKLFLALVMATSTALFALPSDSSMAIAQDSSLGAAIQSDTQGSVEASCGNFRKHDNSRSPGERVEHFSKGDRVCPTGATGATGPTGPTGATGPGFSCVYASFCTHGSQTVGGNFGSIRFESSNVVSCGIKQTDVEIFITEPGVYYVSFGASTEATEGTNNCRTLGLILNGQVIPCSQVNISQPNSSFASGLQGTELLFCVSERNIAEGGRGASLAVVNTGNNLLDLDSCSPTGGTTCSGTGVSAYLTLFRICDKCCPCGLNCQTQSPIIETVLVN